VIDKKFRDQDDEDDWTNKANLVSSNRYNQSFS
jgi:hypothetical protein